MTKHTEGEKVLLRRERLAEELKGCVGYRLYVRGFVSCSLVGEITNGGAVDVVGPLGWVERVKVRLEKLHPGEVYTIEMV